MVKYTLHTTLLSISLSSRSLTNFSMYPNPSFNLPLQNQSSDQIKWNRAFAKDVLIPKIIDAPLLEKYGVLDFFDS